MSDIDAKMPERVIFRVNPTFYLAISELADSANRSVNGEICTAVDNWLYRRDSLVLMKDRLLASASANTIEAIRRATPSYGFTPDSESDTCKTNVRFKDSVAVDLRAQWDQQKILTGHVSMNSFLKIVVAWWLSYSYQLAECAKAIHSDFQNSIIPHRPASQGQMSMCRNLACA
ncbi:hypothetical protein [Pseudomonas syringae]|uniref:hypothetical protein n=2 Tax=Pseudomonas syringae TaxID=317 RepID=UPI001F15C9A4|nr:hypothetical protein [Pseudomonas syringae]MCF5371922.1 hypothetical protein [Pseudomonas syringae]MCF5382498.1 hypothetical protein [Pseudomonas syringae]MCF5419385.1 hypothetical protein [Pseudomonas syringae]MCF5451932.1 hypothetical protein [Pseudomonas syringae]